MNWKRLHPEAYLEEPRPGDAGYDLRCLQDHYIEPQKLVKIKTGIAIEIPRGFVGFIKERSSLGSKGLAVRGGVIDHIYRGEIVVVLQNLNNISHFIPSGSKVAQLVVIPYAWQAILHETNELSETERGTGGFGSTGQ